MLTVAINAVAPAAGARARGRAAPRCAATATPGCSAGSAAPALEAVVTTRRAALRACATAAVFSATQLGASPLPARAAASAAPGVGDAAPAFSLGASTGGNISLADLTKSGKYTVLYFYNQDLSPGCSLEAARFQQAAPAFAAANAQVIGVSMDSLEKHAEFCKQKELAFPLLSDSAGDVSAAYGADLTIPLFGKFSDRQTFLIDNAGVIRAKWLERDGSMASVKTPQHTEQVLAAIAALPK